MTDTGERERNPLHALRNALPDLGGASRGVAEIILADPTAVASLPITVLSQRAQTTPSTVSRLAVQLGYDGYPALRAAIATENGRTSEAEWEREIGTDIAMDDPADLVLKVLAGRQAQALRNTVEDLDTELINEIAGRVSRAERVHIFGSWGDAVPGRELHMRLMRIGVPAWFHESSTSAVISAGQMTELDVAIVLSRAGDDLAATEFLQLARSTGAFTVALTGARQSLVSEAAEHVVDTGTLAGEHWTDYFAGRASDSLAASLLWVLVAQKVPGAIASHHEEAERESGSATRSRRRGRRKSETS